MSEKPPTNTITGGAGFLGTHLTRLLLNQGHRVHVFDNLESAADPASLSHPNLSLQNGDVRNRHDLLRAFKGADCVFHLAARADLATSLQDPAGTYDTNVTGTLNVVLAARQAGVAQIVFASSSAVYGNQSQPLMHEDMTPAPLSPYGLQKYMAEQIVAFYAGAFHGTVSLRFSNLYGPLAPPRLLIPSLIRNRREGTPQTVYGDGLQTRAYLWHDDAVEACISAARVSGAHVLNAGTNRQTSVLELARLVGTDVRHVDHPYPESEERHKAADGSRAQRVLGWQPRTSLEDGLARLQN